MRKQSSTPAIRLLLPPRARLQTTIMKQTAWDIFIYIIITLGLNPQNDEYKSWWLERIKISSLYIRLALSWCNHRGISISRQSFHHKKDCACDLSPEKYWLWASRVINARLWSIITPRFCMYYQQLINRLPLIKNLPTQPSEITDR